MSHGSKLGTEQRQGGLRPTRMGVPPSVRGFGHSGKALEALTDGDVGSSLGSVVTSGTVLPTDC